MIDDLQHLSCISTWLPLIHMSDEELSSISYFSLMKTGSLVNAIQDFLLA